MRARKKLARSALSLTAALAVGLVSCGEKDRGREPGHPTVVFKEEIDPQLHPDYSRPYAFSDDWFTPKIRLWKRVFASLAGKPGLHYLEIGVYEGRSFIWMLENVLIHSTSRLTAIDIFIPPEVHRRFLDNIEMSGQEQRVTTIKGYSQTELRKLPLASFDIIYVDGSHTADDVLTDLVLSWGLLKTGGIIVLDDYLWDGSYFAGKGSRLPGELVPGMAIRGFMRTHRNYIELIHLGEQVVLKKRDNPCPNKSYCSPIGKYTYDWKEKKLSSQSDQEVVELSQREQQLLEEILWKRRLGQKGFTLPGPFKDDPEVRALSSRLGVAF
jgi:predicted O-methyltransferase YrrM